MLTAMFTAFLLIGWSIPAFASPAETYTYSFWGKPVPAPEPYAVAGVANGIDLGVGALKTPNDLHVAANGTIVLADTGNNRVLVMNKEMKVTRVIDRFHTNDTFNGPEGVFHDGKGQIYVADTGNRRIVVVKEDGTFVRTIGEPKSPLLRNTFQYTPVKLAVDRADRIYVVSKGSYEGILEFESDGRFDGFVGTNKVKFNPIDLLWKRISTKTQRSQMEQFIPLEFNNLDIGQDGFIFTTTSEEDSDQPIKKLNPSGADILRSKGYFPPKGDTGNLMLGSRRGSSIFVDVTGDVSGMYSGLDSKRGRIFTYDKDGNMLYEFGGLGSQQSNFRTPVAIAMQGEQVLVLDRDIGRITTLAPTRYGSLIREAVVNLSNGKVEASTAAWSKVLQLNANYDIAYSGIGKSLLKKGENREAITYFKLGNNREWYSEAFKRYRKEVVQSHFGTIVLIAAIVIAFIAFAVKWGGRRLAGQYYEEVGMLRNPFYTMIHPFNGFWEMKYEHKGRIKIALAILFALVVFLIIKQQYSGFVVNFSNPAEWNSMDTLKFVVLPFVLWCVANWSLTTLMDGEGKFREIVMATAYALMPFLVIYLPQTLYSNVITQNEASFYYLLDGLALVWFIWLLFVGTMTVHQYTPSKTVATMLLTLVVIGIMLFLGVLFFSMLQQMISFAISIFRELSFRY
ncbi:YIP1 family protein [Paenibacillus aurantius]|uniref:YIP1 family protein n=1 Tax=Paenibacillus aurantius TaxID=2918900 RepID=A0AA96LLA3_9BACL|nr:YIP1 family protein [Paenibacillus aurantius]WNQ14191.1 YIP1 family protein [Paenibacillus aurantius]